MNIKDRFHKSVNMTPAQIHAWSRDPRAKEASFESTRRRLPALAALKAKKSKWNNKDIRFAKRVLSFNARMQGVVNQHGCTRKAVIALRNWGRQPPKCGIPK